MGPNGGPSAVFTGTIPPQRCILSVKALRDAEARFHSTALSLDVLSARAAIDRCIAAVDQQQLSIEAVHDLTAAIDQARVAWLTFIEQVAPVMTPLRVQGEHAEQRVRLEHRSMQLGGAPGATLSSLTVELSFFSKNDHEAMPLVQVYEPK
jgi:hypothetical protein